MTDAPGAQSVGDRLRRAIENRGQSVRWLSTTLNAEGVPKSSYSSVFRYVEGEVIPTVAWMQEAARILQVTPAWIAFGGEHGSYLRERLHAEGAATPVPELVRERGGGAAVLTLAAHGAGEDVLAAIVQALVEAQPDGSPALSDEDQADVGFRLSFVVASLLTAIRGEAPSTMMAAATLGIFGAILGYVPPPGAGRPMPTVVRYLPTPPAVAN